MTLWSVDHSPWSLRPANAPRRRAPDEARSDRERLRLVAQALAGAGLKGKTDEAQPVTTMVSEQAALGKLLANWRALIEASAMPLYDRRSEA